MQKPSPEQIAFVAEVRLRHHAELVSYAMGLVRAARLPGDLRQIAEEVVQNVYLSLLVCRLATPIKVPIAYLKTSVLREFLRCRERQMKDRFWHAEPGDAVVGSVADERSAEPPDVLAQGALERAISRLSPEDQRIIRMFADGMKPQEIADALGISRSAVAEAIRKLRKSVNDVIHGRVR